MTKCVVLVENCEGCKVPVECTANFAYEIGGQTFRFWVTQDLDQLGKVVTHAKSGFKVCKLAIGASYLPAYAKLNSDEARAKMSLDALIDRVGAAKVRSVIAAAE